MEITSEIKSDEYRSFVKNYYLKRDWTKRIAIIALLSVALSIALLLPIGKGWGFLWLYFVITFTFLMLLLFVIPYGILYFQMITKLKKAGSGAIKWLFRISETGVYVDEGHGDKFLPWGSLNKVITANNFIVFSGIKSWLYILPLSAFEGDGTARFFELIEGYRKKPGNKRPNPFPLYFIGLICLIPFLGAAVGVVFIILGITRYRNMIIILMGIAGLSITGYVLRDVIATSNESAGYAKIDTLVISQNYPTVYQQLLGDKTTFTETLNSKLRGPISKFNYKEFHGLVYKIDSTYNPGLPLDKIIKETNEDTHMTYHKTYSTITNYGSAPEVLIIMAKPTAPKNVYFNLFGEKTQVVTKNDSVAYYFSNFKNFFIQYKQAGEQEFFGTASAKDVDGDARMPVEIMFFKQKSNLYFILLAANDAKTNLPADLLYNLVMRKN